MAQTHDPAPTTQLLIDLPIASLRAAILKNPALAIETLRPAALLVSQMDQPDRPISELIASQQAAQLSDAGKKVTKLDLLELAAGTPLASNITITDMQIIQDALFQQARDSTVAAFATAITEREGACCCCTPCCCSSSSGGPPRKQPD